MEGAFDTEKLTAAVVALVFVAAILLLIVAIRRARRSRRREIEESGEERVARVAKPKRAALRPEDVEPGTNQPETAAEPKRRVESEDTRPPAVTFPVGPKADVPEVDQSDTKPPVTQPEVAKVEIKPSLAEPVPRLTVESQSPPATPQMPVDKPKAVEGQAKHKRDARALEPGLARTRAGWISRLGQVFSGKRDIDPALVEEIEKVLLTADIGVRTSQKLLEEIRSSLGKKELADPEAIWRFLRKRSIDFLRNDAGPVNFTKARPFVLLAIGVNGSGKTTTIGKLAAKLREDGKSVLLAAGDTFRAAASEQLEVWGQRVGAPVIRGKEASDPSSVIFDAIKRGVADGVDVVIADTAGRLHTKTNLMDELQKVRRVAAKALEGAPHETWLVIDATSGQNAIAQAQMFTQAMSVTGIVLTKLDGTAKGGVILGIADQLGIPVRYIGIGERVEDLREFDAEEFVEALFAEANPG